MSYSMRALNMDVKPRRQNWSSNLERERERESLERICSIDRRLRLRLFEDCCFGQIREPAWSRVTMRMVRSSRGDALFRSVFDHVFVL